MSRRGSDPLEFPDLEEEFGEEAVRDAASILRRDWETSSTTIKARIRGIDFIDRIHVFVAIENRMRGREDVLEALRARREELEEIGERDEDDNVLPNMTLKRAEQKGLTALIERSRAKQRTHNDQMLTRVPQKFNQWVRTKASTEIRELIEEAYNHEYNAHINPQFDGDTLRVRGMSDTFYGVKDFAVYKHNRAVAEKLVWNGRGANCHDVGAGKTLSSIITSQVLAQQGACNKPMFVVPGKVQEKWVEEYAMLFPEAKILNMKMTGADVEKKSPAALLHIDFVRPHLLPPSINGDTFVEFEQAKVLKKEHFGQTG